MVKVKEAQATMSELQIALGIQPWENSLSLPPVNHTHSKAVFQWEEKYKFTFTSGPKTTSDPHLVFISEKTELLPLLQLLPFFFSSYTVFLCSPQLIQERLDLIKNGQDLSKNNEITTLLHEILEVAVRQRASDIHFENLKENIRVRVRVDGKLKSIFHNKVLEASLLLKIKLISGMDIAQKRKPQDGHFRYICDNGDKYELRTSTIPGIHGEKLVIRLLPTHAVELSLGDLGVSKEHQKLLQEVNRSKIGLVLMTGPTGSGKTTTLYAMLRELMTDELNILTIEDPVEYRMDQITQVEVNELAGVSFSSALRSFLRQDPDVILVGEIRDNETASIVVRAAQTGHLVLSTLHCKDVFEAVSRLRSLGIHGEDLASSLKLIISQRLIRKRCHCEGEFDVDCPTCKGSGVAGRMPVMELLPISDKMKQLLSTGRSLPEIEKQAQQENFISMKKSGVMLAENNRIFINELQEVL